MKYNLLGNSGLKVSVLCMGTMTFGSGFFGIGAVDQDKANEMVQFVLDKGINFFDTADVYSKGESEEILGKAIKASGVPRENVIIATKVRGTMGEDVNDVGLSRHHIMNSVDKSLKRLQVDYIDLYQVHSFDTLTPLEETMRALGDLVRSGKVRYIGASNYAAWQLSKANHIAEKYGWPQFITLQGYYSLVGRGIEFELVPYLKDKGMGILTWSPLAGGLLTGKYKRDEPAPEQSRYAGELKGFIPYEEDQLYSIIDKLQELRGKKNVPIAALSLAWLRHKDAVSSVIIGARTMEQLKENVQAADVEFSEEELAELDELSRVQKPYPQWMLSFTSRDRQD